MSKKVLRLLYFSTYFHCISFKTYTFLVVMNPLQFSWINVNVIDNVDKMGTESYEF